MLTIQTILYPTDFSPLADRALDSALALAQKHEAVLHMLHAVVLHADDPNDPAHQFPDADEVRARLEEIAAGRMARRLEARDAGELDVVRAQRRGISTAPVILEYATEVDADLILMSTHGRRGLSHALLGSVTEEVVRLAACPVLTIRGRDDETAARFLDSVLVPVDFSEHSARAVATAVEICEVYGASLHLLHVFEQPMHPEVYIGGGAVGLPDFAKLEGRLRNAVRDMGSAAGAPADTSVHVREGRAVTAILEMAEELNADMIVIATHGLTGMTHVLLGSVTERVVRRAVCPVLTLKAFGKSLVS